MRTIRIYLVIILVMFFGLMVNAADVTWTGSTGNWTNGANWDTGTAPTNDGVYIGNGGTVQVDSLAYADSINVGYDISKDGGNGTLNISAGSIHRTDSGIFTRLSIGRYYGTGVVNQTSGDFPSNGGEIASIYMGTDHGFGTYNLSGGYFGSTTFYFGYQGHSTAIFNQTGGTNKMKSLSFLINSGTTTRDAATYTISDGVLSCTIGTGRMKFYKPGGHFKVIGGNASITVDNYISVLGSLPKQTLVINSNGLSNIKVLYDASIDGTWNIVNDGAEPGIYNILTANDSMTTGADFVVNVPDTQTWTWGIDTNSSPARLWAEYIPLPTGAIMVVK